MKNMLKKKEFWLVLLVLAIAAFFRFHLIKEFPNGLFPDEAADGLDVNNLLKGHLQAFYPRANGREALFQYLLAGSVLLFGRGPWQSHIISAGIGVISVLTTYLMTKRLFGRKTALVAAFLMATSTWHIVLSHTAFRAIMIPLFETMTIYFIARMVQAKSVYERNWSAIWFGIFFAGGFYTYIAYRIMPAILGVALLFVLIADSQQHWIWVKQFWKAFLYSVIAGIVVIFPLGWYFYKNPGSLTGRSGQVSIFNPDLNHGHLLATFWQVFSTAVTAYFIHGDTNWRQNISGFAFLSPIVSPFFGVAMVVALYFGIRLMIKSFRNRQDNSHWKYLLLIGLFWGMLIPEVATDEGIPHGLRSIGTLPIAYILAAVGMVYVWNWAQRVWHPKFMNYLYGLVAVLFACTLIFTAYEAYFVLAYNTPDASYAYRTDLTAVSDYLIAHPDATHNYLVLDLYSVQTVDYLTTTSGMPYTIVDPANSTSLHLQTGDKLIYTASTIYDFDRYALQHSNYAVDIVQDDRLGEPEMIVISITSPDKGGASIARTADGQFTTIDFGNRLDFAWAPVLPWQNWYINIYQCTDASCATQTLIKQDNQNDYFSNKDDIISDQTKGPSYYRAEAFLPNGQLIKDYGEVTVAKY